MSKITNIVTVKTAIGNAVSAELRITEDRSGKLDQLVAVVQVSILTEISRWNDFREEIISTEYVMEGEAVTAGDLLMLAPASFTQDSIDDVKRVMVFEKYN